jgi:predicted nucleic acid-binding protein
MKYVLDASVAFHWVLPGAHSSKAQSLRDQYQQGIHVLIAPSVFAGEMANGLTKAERQKLILVGHAERLIEKVFRTLPKIYPYDPLLDRAVAISSRTRSGFYDCLYVALAERENCELLTADDKLARNLQTQFPFIKALASFP